MTYPSISGERTWRRRLVQSLRLLDVECLDVNELERLARAVEAAAGIPDERSIAPVVPLRVVRTRD